VPPELRERALLSVKRKSRDWGPRAVTMAWRAVVMLLGVITVVGAERGVSASVMVSQAANPPDCYLNRAEPAFATGT
jgi:hypothetical protein